MDSAALDDIINQLLEVKGRPEKQVQLSESEMRKLCFQSKEIFLHQPNLLELEAPIKVCNPADLWYDDDSCEDYVETSSKAPDMDREWRRRRDQFHTLGYRDGLITGKEAALQEGFNIGFKDFVLTGYNWGLVRGISSAMASLPGSLKQKLVETEETRNKFQKLHESVQCISSTESLKLFYEVQKTKSLKQETAEPSSTETEQSNQSSDAGALENYHVLLQSILHESPLVEGHLKTML